MAHARHRRASILISLILLPLTLLLLAASVGFPPLFVVSGPIAFLTGLTYYHLLGVKRNFARVPSARTQRAPAAVRHADALRRVTFHDEMLRRAGISPSPIP